MAAGLGPGANRSPSSSYNVEGGEIRGFGRRRGTKLRQQARNYQPDTNRNRGGGEVSSFGIQPENDSGALQTTPRRGTAVLNQRNRFKHHKIFIARTNPVQKLWGASSKGRNRPQVHGWSQRKENPYSNQFTGCHQNKTMGRVKADRQKVSSGGGTRRDAREGVPSLIERGRRAVSPFKRGVRRQPLLRSRTGVKFERRTGANRPTFQENQGITGRARSLGYKATGEKKGKRWEKCSPWVKIPVPKRRSGRVKGRTTAIAVSW